MKTLNAVSLSLKQTPSTLPNVYPKITYSHKIFRSVHFTLRNFFRYLGLEHIGNFIDKFPATLQWYLCTTDANNAQRSQVKRDGFAAMDEYNSSSLTQWFLMIIAIISLWLPLQYALNVCKRVFTHVCIIGELFDSGLQFSNPRIVTYRNFTQNTICVPFSNTDFYALKFLTNRSASG